MTRLEKRERYGEGIGSMMAVFTLGMAAFFVWIAMSIGSFVGAVVAILALIYICGGLFMQYNLPGVIQVLRDLRLIPDTRHRVIAMEDYHGIDYTIIPEKHLYVKKGETCELVVRRTKTKP